jgi:rhodanese-related sulfurtransferase
MFFRTSLAFAICALSGTASFAQEEITQASAEFIFHGKQVSIVRDNTQGPPLAAKFAGVAPECARACLGPVQLAEGVKTLGEREVLDFLLGQVAKNTGLMVDARMPEDRAVGFIPGSVNLPHATLEPENGYRNDILTALGAQPLGDGFTFDEARHLLVYDIGPAADDAGALVTLLLSTGYPAERISYYRGGVLMWAALGLSIETGS